MGGVTGHRAMLIDEYLAKRTPKQKRVDYLRTLPERALFNVGRLFAKDYFESGRYYQHGNGPTENRLLVYREFLGDYKRGKDTRRNMRGNYSNVAFSKNASVFFGITFIVISLILSFNSITGLTILENANLTSSPILIVSFLLGVLFLYLGNR